MCRELRKDATSAEKIFWNKVRNKKFMEKKFYRQYPLFFDYLGKETFFIADFFHFEEALVIEIDGAYHKRQKDYDKLRTHIINKLGIEVLRFNNNQVQDELENVFSEIKDHILNKHYQHPSFCISGDGSEPNEIQRV